MCEQGMSLRDASRRKLRMVAAYAEKCRWDVVLLSEVRAEEEGMVWLGQDENLVVVVVVVVVVRSRVSA